MEAQLLHNIFFLVVSSGAAGVVEAESDGVPPPYHHHPPPPLPTLVHIVRKWPLGCKSLSGDGSPLSVHMFIARLRTCPRFNSLLVFTTQIMEKGSNKLQSLFIQTLMMSPRSTVINLFFPATWLQPCCQLVRYGFLCFMTTAWQSWQVSNSRRFLWIGKHRAERASSHIVTYKLVTFEVLIKL